MPTISKKLSQTDYEIIGDTQGLPVPQGVRFTRFKPSNILVDGSAGESHNYYVKPTPAQCAAGGGEDWNHGTNRFYFPRAGIYTISYPSYYIDNNSVNLIASFLTNREAKLTSFNGGGGWKAVDFCVRAQEGDWVQIGYNCPDPAGYTIDFNTGPTIGFFYIYLNEIAAPYIVANKGALVSGGAFQFDADGNGYTKNCFPAGQEVRVGTFRDGKPVYQQTFSVDMAAAPSPAAWQNIMPSTAIPDMDLMVDCKFMRPVDGSSGTEHARSNGSYIQRYSVIAFAANTFEFTFWYTKTTD